MKKNDFIQASARTRVLEKGLISQIQFERMVEADNVEELFHILNETDYGDYFNKLEHSSEYEDALNKASKDFYQDVVWMSPNKDLIKILSLKYDYHNYKVFLKELLIQEDQSELYLNITDSDFMAQKDTLLQLEEEQRKRLMPSFYHTALEAYEKTGDVQLIDIIVDKAYFEELKATADRVDVPMISQYVTDLIDFTNLKTLFRMKRQMKNINLLGDVLIDGGNIAKETFSGRFFDSMDDIIRSLRQEEVGPALLIGAEAYDRDQKLASFEKAFENHAMAKIRLTKGITYGPEVLFSYLLARETEIKNLRMIIISKINQVPAEAIRSRLRGTYA
ncbi:MAG: V-type ATP synthase subunit C [Tissierellia bacterium]|nr:V-type ATP synthase subunit C [Tissierellia bacterium]